jgi:hypothetical protein
MTISTIESDARRSRLKVAGTEVAFHCDKFNTRIIKGLESITGFDKLAIMISRISEETHYNLVQKIIQADSEKRFASLSRTDKLAAIFEIYKVFGYGNFDVSKLTEDGGEVTAKKSYLAEGYLENQQRWNWGPRFRPFCVDADGYIAAAMAITFGKPVGTYIVRESKCRAMGNPVCIFEVRR